MPIWSSVFLLLLNGTIAIAEETTVSVEGGRSFLGGNFSSDYGAATGFVEQVFDSHPIGESSFIWSPDAMVGWIDGRGISSFDSSKYTTRDHVWLIAGGLRFQHGSHGAWYHPLFLSLQPALHTGRTQALSSVYEFVSTLGWQAEHWMVGVRHISNGSLHVPNRGETMLLVGLTFKL